MAVMPCNLCFCRYYPILIHFIIRHPFKPKLHHLNTPSSISKGTHTPEPTGNPSSPGVTIPQSLEPVSRSSPAQLAWGTGRMEVETSLTTASPAPSPTRGLAAQRPDPAALSLYIITGCYHRRLIITVVAVNHFPTDPPSENPGRTYLPHTHQVPAVPPWLPSSAGG